MVEEEPVQDPLLADAAGLVATLRVAIQGAAAGAWRDGALSLCDEQQARFSSVDPFVQPNPVFDAATPETKTLDAAVADAVAGLTELATKAQADEMALLLVSAAASVHGLARQQSAPGEGASPTHLQLLGDQRDNVLSQVWALIAALEKSLAHLDAKDPLREQIIQRIKTAKQLRAALREQDASEAPQQPPFFTQPPMTNPAEITAGWAQMEVALAESLVLLSAQTRDHHDWWRAQVELAQAVGGQIPRWPGWD